jgi:hypothetical protein
MWQCSISNSGFVGPKWQRKIYNVDLQAWGGRWHGLDDITGLGMAHCAHHRGLREDDVVAGSGMAMRAWGRGLYCRWRHRLESGKMVVHKGLNRGWERWCGGSGEDSMMARRLWGGLDDGVEAPGRTQ